MIVTNTVRFPESFTDSAGREGRSVAANTPAEFLQYADEPGAVLLANCDPALTLRLAAALWFKPAAPLVSVDVVLRRPGSLKTRVLLPFRRTVMRRVDHHIHFFRDVRGLQQVWGIGPEKSSFVPFKPNLSPEPDMSPAVPGEYILCFGRSLRDFDTFFDAVERIPYPAAIAAPDLSHLAAHGARFTRPLDRLPANLRLLPDDHTAEAQVQMLRGARIVALPVLKSSIVASGISTCLNAMLFGRCVVGSEGPGMSDIFQDEVLTCPPENPSALADTLRRAWEDDKLRNRTAEAGYRYAQSLGGEPELYQRIIDRVSQWLQNEAGHR